MKKELYASLLLLLVFISCSAMYREADSDTAQIQKSARNQCISASFAKHDFCSAPAKPER